MNYTGPQKFSRGKNSPRPPYWNIYRAVLAGWLIRYPRQMLNILLLLAGLIILGPLSIKIISLIIFGIILYVRATK